MFAFAPVVGAAWTAAGGDRGLNGPLVCGAGWMVAGVLLHRAELHDHLHSQEAMAHEQTLRRAVWASLHLARGPLCGRILI